MRGTAAVKALNESKVDVVWIAGAADVPAVNSFLQNPKIRPMSFPMAEAFTRIFPDLVRFVLPQGVIDLDHIIPRNDVVLIGTLAAPVHDISELESIVAAQAREPNGGLIAMPDSFLNAHRMEITSLAIRYGLPAVYPYRFFTEVGGLLSYGTDQPDNFRRAAIYADRIPRGTKPNELPVQVPFKFELVINLKTAKALGLDVPFLPQQRADEVIE